MTISRKALWLSIMAAPALLWGQAAFAFSCDSTYVIQKGKTFTIMPTGTDDTANIQCAFDEAVAAGRGAKVKLIEGIYKTEQIAVKEFHGSFVGKGMDETVVENLPDLEVTVTDLRNQEPSAEVKWPAILSFIRSNVRVSDMTIRAVEKQPTTGWWYDTDYYTSLAGIILVLGDEASFDGDHLLVEGGPGDFYGYSNVNNGIVAEGNFAGYLGDAQQGSFTVTHSIIRYVFFGVPFVSVQNYRATFRHNVFEDVIVASEAIDFSDTAFEFMKNEVHSFIGIDIYLLPDENIFPDGVTSSSILIRNNTFEGDGYAISMSIPFVEDVRCRLINNDVSGVVSPYYGNQIYLGVQTRDCLVSGSGPDVKIYDGSGENDLRYTPTSDRRFEK